MKKILGSIVLFALTFVTAFALVQLEGPAVAPANSPVITQRQN